MVDTPVADNYGVIEFSDSIWPYVFTVVEEANQYNCGSEHSVNSTRKSIDILGLGFLGKRLKTYLNFNIILLFAIEGLEDVVF
jgi:hypothetical protein